MQGNDNPLGSAGLHQVVMHQSHPSSGGFACHQADGLTLPRYQFCAPTSLIRVFFDDRLYCCHVAKQVCDILDPGGEQSAMHSEANR
jgi:hypothetical protein